MADAGPPTEPARVPLDGIGVEAGRPPTGGDAKARTERAATFASIDKLRNKRYEQQTDHMNAEHEARQTLLRTLSRVLRAWLMFVGGVLLLQGCTGPPWLVEFRLSDNVLLAVLGVTTVNVLGVFLVAARYLFPANPRWMDPTHPPRRSARRRNT